MKKYLSIVAVAAVACAVSSYAQGLVGYQNSSTSLVKKWTDASNSTLVNVPKNTGFVQMMYASSGADLTPWDSSMSGAAFIAANVAKGWNLADPTAIRLVDGRFSGGVLTLTGIAANTSFDFVLMGWTGAASSFDQAIKDGAMANVSGRLTLATKGPLDPPPTLGDAVGNTGFSLAPVTPIPEPSTFALAGLGAAALLIFRRRN